jgi:hypothetical protein
MRASEMSGVILPKDPTLDKIATYAFLRIAQPDLKIHDYWRTNEQPSDGQLSDWKEKGIYAIDVGDEKYTKVGSKSALARVIDKNFFEVTPRVEALVGVIARNNETGDLKGRHLSTALVARDAPLLGRDGEDTIRRIADQIECWLSYPGSTDVDKIWHDPMTFTIPEYLHQTEELGGIETTEISKRASWLADVWRDGQREREVAREVWKRKKFWQSSKAACGTPVIFHKQNEEDSPFLASQVFKVFSEGKMRELVYCTRNPDGRITIMTRGMDMERVCDKLKQLEPSLWLYDNRFEGCFNGSRAYCDVEPTELYDEEILSIIHEHARTGARSVNEWMDGCE